MAIDLRKTRAVAPKRKAGAKDVPAKPLLTEDPVASEIIKRLRESLSPTKISLQNQSKQHASHKGKGKGEHYELTMVCEIFEGISPLQRQKIVNDLLKDLMGKKIHALKMKLQDPTQVKLDPNP